MSDSEISDWTEGEVIEWVLDQFDEETAKCFEGIKLIVITTYNIQ